ncbi:MAG: PfaD family polyunsaturated fatty acid/polyketide biosynthesis protein, partial [Phycisphaerae bacterium]
GIASVELVEAMSRAGMLGFFGAAGLPIDRVADAVDRLRAGLGDAPYGFNLIHSPNEPTLEAAVADLYLRREIRLVSASAYLDLTPPLIRYRVRGIHRTADGRVVCPNRVIAKVSRPEVAKKFLSPPPEAMLRALVESGEISAEQAEWARSIPVAGDLTVEADSGGHTDNRPAVALLPAMLALRDEMQALHGYAEVPRVGAAGGIATPASAAAAFAMGAAYVLTGSVNQACVEAGTSAAVREMLARASQADVAMAPAADMFEMGVKVQVLKWGTMFAVRARKLYDLYRAHGGLDELSAAQRKVLERDFFRCDLDAAWKKTCDYFESRDPKQIRRAETDPKHKMALLFRAYLGQSSTWANAGEPSRKVDYQIWCGPAMGAFNAWARNSFLESPGARGVVSVAMNLLVGAAVLARANALRLQGVPLSPAAGRFRPMPLSEIDRLLQE